jgi:hypothetical protein
MPRREALMLSFCLTAIGGVLLLLAAGVRP